MSTEENQDVPDLDAIRSDLARLIRELQVFHALLLAEPGGIVEQQRQQSAALEQMRASVSDWDLRLDERLHENADAMRDELDETIRKLRAYVQQVSADLEIRMRQRVDGIDATMGPIAQRELERKQLKEKLKQVALEGLVKTVVGVLALGIIAFLVYLISLWIKSS